MIDILFKFPTRGRPAIFQKTYEMWQAALSKDCSHFFVVECDEDDAKMNTPEMKKWIEDRNGHVRYGQSKTKIEAVNANIPNAGWKILWLLSDDVRPMGKNVDQTVIADMQKHFPDLDGILHYSDQLHGKQNLLTVPIIGNAYYQRDKYIYNPMYESLWCDNHQMDVAIARGKHIFLPSNIFTHGWQAITGKDKLAIKNSEPYERDKKRYMDCKDRTGYPELGAKPAPVIPDEPAPPAAAGIILSICICTIGNRKRLLDQLMSVLRPQCNDQIEILIDNSEPPVSIGKKRQSLLERAKGKYVVSIDDDDSVATDYVSRILAAAASEPDAIGFSGMAYKNGNVDRPFVASHDQTKWANLPGQYIRTIYHISPVKREIALRAGFRDKSFGEDVDYSNAIKPMIKTAAFISGDPMYFYQYRSNVSVTANPDNAKRPIIDPVSRQIGLDRSRFGPGFNPANVIGGFKR